MNRIGLLSLLAVSASVAAISVMGCSKDPPPPATPTAQPMVNGTYQTQPGQPAGYPAQPGQPAGYPAQPGQPQPYPQPGQPTQPGQPAQPAASGGFPGFPGFPSQPAQGGGGGTAQPVDANFAALAVGPLTLYANTEAPGMAKDGPTVMGNFQTGQTLEGQFQFVPGKCYTLIAQGAGVTDVGLEMQYVNPVPGLPPVSIGKNSNKGAQVSMGGKANCLKPMSPVAANAKFIVTANAGAGVIAAQLYSK